MEFGERLQRLRTNEHLTQEELAEKLYVSRTAISKWESGRGYPSIDSLKAISECFGVTVDELICGDEMITLAEQDIRKTNKKYTALICGILDCLIFLLFLLPLFGDSVTGNVSSVTVFALTGIGDWLKAIFIVIVSITVANGFCTVVISNFDRPVWNKHRIIKGLVLSVTGTMLFIITRQPYAGVFYLCLLVVKGILIMKRR